MHTPNLWLNGSFLRFAPRSLRGAPTRGLRRGSMMVTSLAFVAIACFLGMALLSSAVASTRLSIHRRDSQAAFELAEAGVQHAKRRLDADPTYGGQANTAFGGGWFRLEVTPHPTDTTRVQLVSTGRVLSGKGGYVERQVRSTMGWSKLHPVWNYTIFGDKLVDLKERLRVTSSPVAGQAWVHSNDLTRLGSVSVDGMATAVTSVLSTTDTVITGPVKSGVAPVPLPELNKAFLLTTAEKNGTYPGNLSLTSGTHTLQGKIIGNVTIGSSAHVDIKGPLWVTGNLTVSGRSWAGNGAVFVEGKILVDTSSSILPGAPDDLALVSFSSAPDAIKITSRDNSDKITVRGGVFAPNGGVVLGGKVGINGSVIGQTVTASGTGSEIDVYRSSTYQPPVAMLTAVEYWEAL